MEAQMTKKQALWVGLFVLFLVYAYTYTSPDRKELQRWRATADAWATQLIPTAETCSSYLEPCEGHDYRYDQGQAAERFIEKCESDPAKCPGWPEP